MVLGLSEFSIQMDAHRRCKGRYSLAKDTPVFMVIASGPWQTPPPKKPLGNFQVSPLERSSAYGSRRWS